MTTILIILIGVSFITVYKVIGEIMESRACPDDITLRKVVLGQIPKRDGTSKRVIRHLGTCNKCQAKVDELNQR